MRFRSEAKNRSKIGEFLQETRIKYSGDILDAVFKCSLKLSTAGNFSFRGRLISPHERAVNREFLKKLVLKSATQFQLLILNVHFHQVECEYCHQNNFE